MGITKTGLFNERQNKLAQMAKIMAHPARIAILDYIIRTESCICNDLVEELKLAQPTVSQHLKELKNAGLLTGTIDGNSVNYSLNMENWKLYKETFIGFFADKTTLHHNTFSL